MLLPLLLATSAAIPQPAAEARRHVEATIRFLADDRLEGRGTPGRALDLAALYLANELRAAGVEPAFGDSYEQRYELGEYTPSPDAVSVTIGGVALARGEFLLLFAPDPAQPITADLVFAGHGVVSDEPKVDELSGLDLRGKAVVALADDAAVRNDAGFGPTRLVGKSIESTIRGASLLVYVVDDLDAATPSGETKMLKVAGALPVAFLPSFHGAPTMGMGPGLVISRAAFDRTLAKAAGGAAAELAKRAPRKPRDLGVPLTLRIAQTARTATAANVGGVLRGSDPTLRDEWVVLTAHYDHLGTVPVKPGEDGVYNGADDNASGTAAVLEIARRLAAGAPPKRSVLFLFTSGEERGLLGSAWYSVHPIVAADRVAVDVNVDMVGRSTGRVQGIAELSPELFRHAVEIGAAHSIAVDPDQQPSWRICYLSDDYHFTRLGVPAIEFFTGLHADYHQPSDEASKIRFDELGRILDAMSELARDYADGAKKPAYVRPAWFLTPPGP